MNTSHEHPHVRLPWSLPLWSSQDLTDAVPRRLSELITPGLMRFDNDLAANHVAPSPRAFDWRRRDELSAFRVR